ncbi:MAG: hypothetical protein QF645_03355 [Planctomycetota bacterium]|nr:hypothetical protein [Planctomycetota bacterium]
MGDAWVHPPGWDPESKAKAAAEQKENRGNKIDPTMIFPESQKDHRHRNNPT